MEEDECHRYSIYILIRMFKIHCMFCVKIFPKSYAQVHKKSFVCIDAKHWINFKRPFLWAFCVIQKSQGLADQSHQSDQSRIKRSMQSIPSVSIGINRGSIGPLVFYWSLIDLQLIRLIWLIRCWSHWSFWSHVFNLLSVLLCTQ